MTAFLMGYFLAMWTNILPLPKPILPQTDFFMQVMPYFFMFNAV